ncbi:MAG: hypothetical protein PF795_08315 [Kiritimatiellae bacterium]|nr:hypothetical protein [Kiritimatiellia bacterium]
MTLKNNYPTEPKVNRGAWPDPFSPPGGDRIQSPHDWPACAAVWREMILDVEYGGMPPPPKEPIRVETLSHGHVHRWAGDPKLNTYRLHITDGARPFTFCVRILFPNTHEKVPAIIKGDGCWWYETEELAKKVLAQGCALVLFNRTEMAEDLGYGGAPDRFKRSGGLYDVYPGQTFGALSAWAWGYHRCVDLLHQLDFIDREKIAVTGHSRGGKAALIAGASDSRITLVNDNASCAGGSAAFRYVGESGETLDIINVFPSWFGTGLKPYLGREEAIPFDQHCFLATIAPRPLLTTYSLDDRWSNPEGMVQCVEAAREVYRFLDAPNALAYHFREGGHTHAPEDWDALLRFIAWQWQGGDPDPALNQHPYDHLNPAFDWRAPGF